MEEKNFYSFEELKDEVFGVVGTKKRDEYEAEVMSFIIGDAIKKVREESNLTQTQLGEIMGVQKSQVSKIESGRSLTWATIIKAFKALGIETATLDLGSFGKVAVW